MFTRPLNEELQAQMNDFLGTTDIRLFLKTDWSSSSPMGRHEIRRHIFLNIEADEQILNLNNLPICESGSLSISHNRQMGGYVHTNQNFQLGFDIEVSARLNDSNVRLFASTEEIRNARGAPILWTAKEAAYKCLPRVLQPTVIGEIELTNWRHPKNNWTCCQIGSVKSKHLQHYSGAIYSGQEYTLAFFKGPQSQRSDGKICVGY